MNMKLRITVLLILTFLGLQNAYSKSSGVKGAISDSKKAPVEFANVFIIKSSDSTIVKSALTDASGAYTFTDISAGEYMVMVMQLGYQRYYSAPFMVKSDGETVSMKEIGLEDIAVNLKEANITAKRPFIEHHIDKTVVNVENSIINAGSTVLEILKRCPGVTVDNDGNIHLSGKDGVNIMMDGKPTYLSVKDLYDLLRNMNSDQLNSIEIITNPSAKYDAAGNSGIINIKLKKRQDIGLNGNLHGSFGQGAYPDYSGGFSLNYGREKFNVFGGYDYGKGYYYETSELSRRFFTNGENSRFSQESFNKGHYTNHNFQAGADYYISKKHSLSAVIRGNFSDNFSRTTATTNIANSTELADSGYVTINTNTSQWDNLSGTLNYTFKIDTLGQELTVDGDMAQYSNRNDYDFYTEHFYSSTQSPTIELATDDQPSKIDVRSFKLDYTLPLKGGFKFEAGAKSSYVTTDNDVKYFNYIGNTAINDTTKTNHFNYKENIHALYTNVTGEIKKFGFEVGLRGEQTVATGKQSIHDESFSRNYIQLFPSAFVNYKFTDDHMVKMSYSRRIDRPEYQRLNPFRNFIDQYTFQQGNPDLKPQMTDNFDLSYIFKQMYSATFTYSHTTDNMTELAKQIDSTHTTFITTENLPSTNSYALTLSIPLQVTEWWNSSNDFSGFNNHFRGLSSVGYIDKKMTSFYLNSTNNFSLKNGWSFELNGFYQSSLVWGTWLLEPQWSVGGGIGKSFLDDRLNMKVNINDIFHTQKTNATVQYSNVDVKFRQVQDTQFVRIHLSYSFGKKGLKKAEHRVGADEENRIRTGH
jgi:outer membrane receptor protein involved in Fe transport